jgi:hypothetical protein
MSSSDLRVLKQVKLLRAFGNFTLYVGGLGSLYHLFTRTYVRNPKYQYINDMVFNEFNFASGVTMLCNVIFISLVLGALASILENQVTDHSSNEDSSDVS